MRFQISLVQTLVPVTTAYIESSKFSSNYLDLIFQTLLTASTNANEIKFRFQYFFTYIHILTGKDGRNGRIREVHLRILISLMRHLFDKTFSSLLFPNQIATLQRPTHRVVRYFLIRAYAINKTIPLKSLVVGYLVQRNQILARAKALERTTSLDLQPTSEVWQPETAHH